MTSRDFVYWLQGFFEINRAGWAERGDSQLLGISLNNKQVECIQNHLNMVFVHEIDPSHGDAAHQGELSAAHQGKPQSPVTQYRPPGSTLLRC
jgi:hypothetical protein